MHIMDLHNLQHMINDMKISMFTANGVYRNKVYHGISGTTLIHPVQGMSFVTSSL